MRSIMSKTKSLQTAASKERRLCNASIFAVSSSSVEVKVRRARFKYVTLLHYYIGSFVRSYST